MYTNNRVFIDTSILVEALKGTKQKLYYSLISNNENECCINSIVVSEYLYFLLGFSGGASPRSLKESGKIAAILAAEINQTDILNDFTLLETNTSLSFLVPHLMSKYNLLPNDAIILATCKINGITKLASHDKDYIIPCQQEGIEFLTETA